MPNTNMSKNTGKTGVKNNDPVFSVILLIAGIALVGLITRMGWDPVSEFFGLTDTPTAKKPAEGIVQVHFIDVGQGDCILILTNKNSVLIDSGDVSEADKVVQYIKQMGVQRLDLIIATHPHADHIGAMDKVMKNINVKRLIMPRMPDDLVPTSNVFERMLDVVEARGVQLEYARAGEIIEFDDAMLEILAPDSEINFDGVNDFSIVARLIHGDNSFLFTGDIESAAEDDILNRNLDISANVIKIAHHGSRTSSQRGFLEKVNGFYAVISVGSPNRYNHPNDDVVRRLGSIGYSILRTDEMGTIVFESSPAGLEIITDFDKLELEDAA